MQIDFIPLPLYTPLWYHLLLLITVIAFVVLQRYKIEERDKYRSLSSFLGWPLLLFSMIYMGLRPIGYAFGDMGNYALMYDSIRLANYMNPVSVTNDPGFSMFINFFAGQNVDPNIWFLICAVIYIYPTYVVSKRWFGKSYWVIPFIMLLGSFSFWAFGTNGIRNGMATALFLLGLSCKKDLWRAVWFIVAASFHASLLLPIACYVVARVYSRPKVFFYIWLACIPLSLIGGGAFQSLFAGLLDDGRNSYLTSAADQGMFASTGFRWDFLLYSATGVVAGWYYLFKAKIKDRTYNKLLITYLLANSFWVLVIKANYSNRFAYLSWFLLALVICYPWIKLQFTKNQSQKLSYIVAAYYLFTYGMFILA